MQATPLRGLRLLLPTLRLHHVLRVLLRLFVELGLALLRAEVVGLVAIGCLRCGVLRLDVHAADWVSDCLVHGALLSWMAREIRMLQSPSLSDGMLRRMVFNDLGGISL